MSARMWLAILLVGVTSRAGAVPPITAAAFTPDGKQVLLGSQAGVELRSWPELKVTSQLKTDLSHVHDLSFSPDGKTLLAGGGSPAEHGAVEVLDWPAGNLLRRVVDFKDVVYRVAWSPNGTRWAAASGDGTICVYDAESGKQLVRYEGHSRAVIAVVFLPDGKMMVSAGVDQTLQVWEAATGKHVRTLDNHLKPVNELAVRPCPADTTPVLASVSEDSTVRLWQPTIGRLIRFKRLESVPRVVIWSLDGKQLLVGCNDGAIRVLDPDTLETVAEKRAEEGRIHALLPVPKAGREVMVGGSGARRVEW